MKRTKHSTEPIIEKLRHADVPLGKAVRQGNGPELVSNFLDGLASLNEVTSDLRWPGEPIDNAFMESLT